MEKRVLTPEERERFDVINACIAGEITNAEAASRLRLTVRQTQRLKRKVEDHNDQAVIHGNKGKVSNNATREKTVIAVETFFKEEKHRDFGPTFAMEQLQKKGGIVLGLETLRTLMIKKGLWDEHKRRGPGIHREWRERVAMYGEMIQFDGSYHDWLENGEEQCLLGAIDDATGTIMRAIFDDNEGVHAVFRFWWAYIEAHGLPVAVYLDKFSTYKVNHKAAVDNAELITQFERAMEEVGVKLIKANSPEGKGRVERLFGTLQDRLVKEMRLANIKDRESANRFLKETYLPDHNKRFSVSPRQEGDAHRRLTDDMKKRLPSIFSIQSKRNVNNDYTIRFKNKWFQLAATQETTVYKSDTVIVEERLDGSIHIRLKDTYLAYTELPTRPQRVHMKVTALTREKPRWKPPAGHPWKRAAARAAENKKAKISRNAR